jgi:hypothetical protein
MRLFPHADEQKCLLFIFQRCHYIGYMASNIEVIHEELIGREENVA